MQTAKIALLFAFCALAHSQDAPASLTVTYKTLFEAPASSSTTEYVAQATVTNSGSAVSALSATISSSASTTVIRSGEVNFGSVGAGATVSSTNTFVFIQSNSVQFNPSVLKIKFSNTAFAVPTANAGTSQNTVEGKKVTLNGSGSTDPTGKALSYLWALTTKPNASAGTLSKPLNVTTTFTPEASGKYVASLVVFDGLAASAVATTTVGVKVPAPPTANAGRNQTVNFDSTVTLNGSASSDPNGLPLTYSWSLTSIPLNSKATLSNPTSVMPTFIADQPGTYTAQLIVNNGFESSQPATTNATDSVSPPVANAGTPQTVNAGQTVQLNGSGSTDPQGLPLTYEWAFLTIPAGSQAALSNPTSVMPTFTADLAGTYVAQLTVNNGYFGSSATVQITSDNVAPTANAGVSQIVTAGAVVQLNGSQSTDPSGDPLTFQWSFTSIPAGSQAVLSNATAVNPTFVADINGTYVVQLLVYADGLTSAPVQTIVSTGAIPPTANAGQNQHALVGATVTLNGNGSIDYSNLPLTYAWTFLSIPQGSAALPQPHSPGETRRPAPELRRSVYGEDAAALLGSGGRRASLVLLAIHASERPRRACRARAIRLSPARTKSESFRWFGDRWCGSLHPRRLWPE